MGRSGVLWGVRTAAKVRKKHAMQEREVGRSGVLWGGVRTAEVVVRSCRETMCSWPWSGCIVHNR